jgi:hypothetical protein
MKKIIPIFFLLLFANNLFAQDPCTDEIIMAIKGKWARRPDANMKAGNQAQVISRIDKMQQLLQAAYPEPMGIEAAWYRSMGGYNSSVSSTADSYVLNALFKTYYCNTNVKKLLLGTETGNWFYVWVNKFSWFAQADDKFLVENKPVYLLTKKLGELNGFPLYAGSDNGASNTGTKFSKTILISRPGQLPYTPVSRKQYLLVFLKNKEDQHKQYIESLLKMPVRSDAEEETYKQQQLERVVNQAQNEYSKEKVKANFLRGYKTARQRQQDDINRVKDVYQRDIKAAQDYLTNTAGEELAKPAYMENTSYYGSFRKFAKENEGMMMVQVNGNYFNNKLPAHAPQFLVVYWSWNTEKPSLDFSNHIENNFNFQALQAMLDK